jgi:hypothetical protein
MSYDDFLPDPGNPFATVNQYTVDYSEQNKGVTPVFFTEAELNPAKSLECGTPRYDEVERVRLFIAGDNLSQPVKPVDDEVKARFGEQYAKWKANKTARQIDGTPLSAWPALTPLQVREFEAMNIFSVEGLVACADTNIAKLPEGRVWRQRAIAHLALAKDSAAVEKYAVENERLRDSIEEMGKRMTEMEARMEASRAGIVNAEAGKQGGKRAA